MLFDTKRESSLLISDHFLSPDDQETFNLLVYELGGIGLNDPSAGLRYQTWTGRYFPTTGEMSVSAPNTPPTTLFTRSGITEIDLAFDQNMRPFVAFVENGDAKYWWCDTDVQKQVFSNLPAGSLTPRCCMDDKRETQTNHNDITLGYVHGGDLKIRIQRDRFGAEYTIQSPFLHPKFQLPAVLERIGMNKVNRLQYLCNLADPLDWCLYKAEVA